MKDKPTLGDVALALAARYAVANETRRDGTDTATTDVVRMWSSPGLAARVEARQGDRRICVYVPREHVSLIRYALEQLETLDSPG